MNLRPSGYEPDELPDCSTPRRVRCQMSDVRCQMSDVRQDGGAMKRRCKSVVSGEEVAGAGADPSDL